MGCPSPCLFIIEILRIISLPAFVEMCPAAQGSRVRSSQAGEEIAEGCKKFGKTFGAKVMQGKTVSKKQPNTCAQVDPPTDDEVPPPPAPHEVVRPKRPVPHEDDWEEKLRLENLYWDLEFIDDVNQGQRLPKKEMIQARLDELKFFNKMGVYRKVDRAMARGKPLITTR